MVEEGYWAPQEAADELWIGAFHWTEHTRDGEALWYRELVWKEEWWIDWTRKHPEIAGDFWPKVFQLMQTAEGRDQVAHVLIMTRIYDLFAEDVEDPGIQKQMREELGSMADGMFREEFEKWRMPGPDSNEAD